MSAPPPLTPGDAERDARLFETLRRLLAISETELRPTLDQACNLVGEALAAEKVDLFLYRPEIESLVALGTSQTPMGRRQHELGLDRIPLANGGLSVESFRSGRSSLVGHAEDSDELRGIVQGLGVRSELICPIDVNGERRGVLSAASARPDFFTVDDLAFVEAVAGWMALVVNRAELFEERAREAVRQGRREAADELARREPRQREIAGLVAEGLSNDEIADRLVLMPGTVANHVEAILDRLQFRSRTQIAVWAVEHGLYRRGQRDEEA